MANIATVGEAVTPFLKKSFLCNNMNPHEQNYEYLHSAFHDWERNDFYQITQLWRLSSAAIVTLIAQWRIFQSIMGRNAEVPANWGNL